MSKDLCILLGAGFSKATADLPTMETISTLIEKVIQSNPNIASDFKRFIFKHSVGDAWNYESCAELIQTLRKVIKNQGDASYFFKTTQEVLAYSQSFDITEDLIYYEVLKQLINPSADSVFQKLQQAFKQFIFKLVAQGFTIHIFDLNHDLVVEELFAENNNGYSFENFFKHYEVKRKFELKSKDNLTHNLYLLEYDDDLTSADIVANIYHYKPHGSLNITYLEGWDYPVTHNRYNLMTGPHLLQVLDQNNKPEFGIHMRQTLIEAITKITYESEEYGKHELRATIINYGFTKGSLLTRDFVRYLPDCYAKFSRLGALGAPLLTIGYGYKDNHINNVIQRYFDTELYTSYQEHHAAKILFSGKEDIPLITKPLKEIALTTDIGLMRNNHGRKVICSSKYFKDYLEKCNLS